MKLISVLIAPLLGAGFVRAQGTLVYDQESTGIVEASAALSQTPLGQSFTPTLDSIGFVDLQLLTGSFSSTVAVNLRGGSITGTILGTSTSVTVPSGSTGNATYEFLFSSPVSLTPGTQYYLEPVVVSGGNSRANITFFQYPGGDAIFDGVTHTDRDFWFREGILVPEPSLPTLFAAGACVMLWLRRKQGTT
jgi:hypothetical protein